MNHEDYVPKSNYYDPETDIFSDMATAEPWDIDEGEWDSYGDWVYEGEYTDIYDDYYDQF